MVHAIRLTILSRFNIIGRRNNQARTSFEPALDALRIRTVHVMKRLFSVVEHMLKSDGMQMSETHQKPFSECL